MLKRGIFKRAATFDNFQTSQICRYFRGAATFRDSIEDSGVAERNFDWRGLRYKYGILHSSPGKVF